MNTNRFQSTRRVLRPTLHFGVSPMIWSGTAIAFGFLLAVLFCMLTHRIPV
jgi:hypothetical protein